MLSRKKKLTTSSRTKKKKVSPSRKSKSLRRKLIDRADSLLQIYYRTQKLQCINCDKQADIMHHIVRKEGCAILRYDPLNLVPLCNSCHFKHHILQDPQIALSIINFIGEKQYRWLMTQRMIKQQLLTKDLQSHIEYYEYRIKGD